MKLLTFERENELIIKTFNLNQPPKFDDEKDYCSF
jgi:hypothetical protein